MNMRGSKHRARLLLWVVLICSSAAALGLVAFRMYYSGQTSFAFLVWNLFLAWIPLWLACGVDRLERSAGRWPIGATLVGLVWLLFLPNAPYLLTDVVHLTPSFTPLDRPLPRFLGQYSRAMDIPQWYDVLMLVVFAWQGLLLGFVALFVVQGAIRRRVGTGISWAAAAVILALCAFGISLGRFQRWNSWDLFNQPGALLADIVTRVTDPLSHPQTLGTTLLLSAFLMLAYLTIVALSGLAAAADDRHLPLGAGGAGAAGSTGTAGPR